MAPRVGDRITVFGGYEYEPAWLGGRDHVEGTVRAWIPGQGAEPSCVVMLDQPITADGDVRGRRESRTGRFLVLSLRHVGQTWESTGTVHVELSHSEPQSLEWERMVGSWVESHATYQVGR